MQNQAETDKEVKHFEAVKLEETQIPIVDIGVFANETPLRKEKAKQLRSILKTCGFFTIVNHGIPVQLQDSIKTASKEFFSLPKEEKRLILAKQSTATSNGYFTIGDELTNGQIDYKEGIYYGPNDTTQEHLPYLLLGPNPYPKNPPNFKSIIQNWKSSMSNLGSLIMSAIAQSLELPKDYFSQGICKDHFQILGLLHYPHFQDNKKTWGTGQHTDYGLITILMVTSQGLEVKSRYRNWIKVKPIPNSFVINVGDMLERLTRGLYKSNPHRVRNLTGAARYSFPYFYQPGFFSEVKQIDLKIYENEEEIMKETAMIQRWDKKNLSQVRGIYGDYVTKKVYNALPDLKKSADSIISGKSTQNMVHQ